MRAIARIGALLKGKYCLLQKLGRGGEGIVYLARDVGLGKLWCIKVAAISDGQRIFCRLGHERIPQVVDYWEEEEKAYLVMEYISGCSLGEKLRQGVLSKEMKMRWSRQLLLATGYLHKQKPPIVHGDIKPENLLISQEGQLYLIDFGSAELADESHDRSRKGTKGFAAPEQMEGRCTVQSDIYGLGRVLQQLWHGSGFMNWRLWHTIRKAQRRNAGDRYGDDQSMLQDLERAFRVWDKKNDHSLLLFVTAALAVMLAAGISLGEKQGYELDVSRENSFDEKVMGKAQDGVTLEQVHNAAIQVFQKTKISGEENSSFDEAKRLGEALLLGAENKQESHVLLLLAKLCETNGRTAAARSFYQVWMKKNPKGTEGRILYGLMLLEQGKEEESLRLYQDNAKLFGEDTHNYCVWRDRLKKIQKH